jgi:hypothetical protein
MGMLVVGGYLLIIIAGIIGLPLYGWLWIIILIVLALGGFVVLHPIWPFPLKNQCVTIATRLRRIASCWALGSPATR